MRRLILPPPPGTWRTRHFSHPLKHLDEKNQEPVTIVAKKQEAILKYGEEIEITWHSSSEEWTINRPN